MNPKKYICLKFTPKKIPGIIISYQNSTRVKHLDIDLFNLKENSSPQKIRDRFLDPQKCQGCKFSTQKNTSDLPVIYPASTPHGALLCYTSQQFRISEISCFCYYVCTHAKSIYSSNITILNDNQEFLQFLNT